MLDDNDLAIIRKRARELFDEQEAEAEALCSGMATFCFETAAPYTMAACYEQALQEYIEGEV